MYKTWRKGKNILEESSKMIENLEQGFVGDCEGFSIHKKIHFQSDGRPCSCDHWLLEDEAASELDKRDPLKNIKDRFLIPKASIYLCGHSLGLQPKMVRQLLCEELDQWGNLGVEGHFEGPHPWVDYDEECVSAMSQIVGALDQEVVMMNSLTVNIHLMLAAFYNPTPQKYRIVVEKGVFPSDQFAIQSHQVLRGFGDRDDALVFLEPRDGKLFITEEDIISHLEKYSDSIALLFLEGVNYYNGRVLNMKAIARAAQIHGVTFGIDLAHGVGNIPLKLHDWGVDFSVWCSYKYLNSGPGGIGGCFIHDKHLSDSKAETRLCGWWSHDKKTRFQMKANLTLGGGALSFQLSNPSIFSLASLRASLSLFQEIGMEPLIKKGSLLSSYLLVLLHRILETKNLIKIITPFDTEARGCQISFLLTERDGKTVTKSLRERGVLCDFREPKCIRVAPNPFYNSFRDVRNFVTILEGLLTC